MKQMKLLLVGCGNYAREAHLHGIKTFIDKPEHHIDLYVADVNPELQAIQPRPPGAIDENWFIHLDQHDENACLRTLDDQHKVHEFDACIVSTRPRHHQLYVKWALSREIHVLVDKPLTFPDKAHVVADKAREIVGDFKALVNLARANNLLFLLGAQKRFQVVYRDLGGIIQRVYEKTGCPVTNVVCCTGDGWWVLPDEYSKPFHSYEFGGKLIHTGYHFLDIVPWLMRHAALNGPLPISHAWVTASLFRPADSYGVYGKDAAENLFSKSTNLEDITNKDKLGEINANLMVTLCDKDDRQRASILYSLLHEGFSRRSPVDKEAVAGRTKTDYLAITQGPVLWAELRRIAKVGVEGDRLGGPAHQELTVLCNEQLTPLGNQATLTVRNQPLYAANSGAVSSCCENDEAPTVDFLKQVNAKLNPGLRQPDSLSPVADHVIGVQLLSAAYESSSVYETLDDYENGRRRAAQPTPVRVDFCVEDWIMPPGIS